MKKYISDLKRTQLFSGVSEKETEAMLSCLQARLCAYEKGEYIIRQGESIENIMILAEGKLHIQRDDYWGNRSIINVVETGDIFGEAYALSASGATLNDVLAVEKSTVIFFDAKRVITTCSSACSFHSKVVQNLFFAISEKNRRLVQKLDYMSRRSTREKLIAYLSDEAEKNNSSCFEIALNRQQMADFLSVDRSAMSNELCKMRDEGLLEFQKNKFTLLQ